MMSKQEAELLSAVDEQIKAKLRVAKAVESFIESRERALAPCWKFVIKFSDVKTPEVSGVYFNDASMIRSCYPEREIEWVARLDHTLMEPIGI
jgi:hypothetical protein